MSESARAYTFATPAQWQRCLATGFDFAGGGLQPIARLGSTPRQFTSGGPVTLLAADLPGELMWRTERDGRRVLVRRTEMGGVSEPYAIDSTLAAASRWVLQRHWLWAFDAESRTVLRYDRDEFAEDVAIDLGTWAEVRDISADGADGLWVLVADRDRVAWLLHLDCHAHAGQPMRVPAEVRRPWQLGTVARGKRLVLLGRDGRVSLIDAGDGHLVRAVGGWSDDPCCRALRLVADSSNRIALLCADAERGEWGVFLLDSAGDTIDSVKGPQGGLAGVPADIALSGGVLWLGADDGLWQLDASDASVGRESYSELLTPALFSPEGAMRGWLRAEIDVDLPRGAVIEAQWISAADEKLVSQAAAIAADASKSAVQRRDDIWNLLDPDRAAVFHITGAPGKGQPVAVPLFQAQDRYLWLRLKMVTPPGVAPPRIGALRVLYPDASLMEHVPAVFRGREGDPTGFFRSIVGVLETTTQGIDARIRAIGSQIDPSTAPPEWLNYVARWLELPWEDSLPVAARRRVTTEAGRLLELRGTRRGLELLLQSLAGPGARVRIVDLTVDHPPLPLAGGDGCGGARLPLLLAGPVASAPILGSRTVLGRACLGASGDPLRPLVPTLWIEIAATRAVQRDIGPLLPRVLAQYVPAGIAIVVRWRAVAEALLAIDPVEGDVLDADGPGRLGEDSEIGRVVLGGRGAATLDNAGLDVGFPLS